MTAYYTVADGGAQLARVTSGTGYRVVSHTGPDRRMFVSIPTRSRPALRWATPLLCATLWGVYLWASTRPELVEQALRARWGALTGGLAPGDLLASWSDG